MLRRAVLSACLVLSLAGAAFAQETPPPAPPRVTIETTMGAVTFEMDTAGAPKTSAHMLRLFRTRHYVGAGIFRVEPGFLIQLGDLDRNLVYRQPPYTATVPLETENNRHMRGGVALAHGDDPNSGRSSFYFELADNPHLNATPGAAPNTTGFAVFGKVVEGMDVLDRIAAVELDPAKGPFPGKLPATPIVITAVRVE
ncbi:MAG: peptidylprolyl isomerase [Hyphomonadaceae bacterium]|nr:MAG: peptidyl-prolyl cis-trans isomerase [Caulobacteraceae bacterium]MBT9444161.1 peptidylprolyl isomerase [Hyphomonadaceae bacterium]TPW04905.1 MAG: peptidyl-prolyl cis-trans isomerase [Alphaproteobacteria bacterium]